MEQTKKHVRDMTPAEELGARVLSSHMDAIQNMLDPAMKLTLVARHPTDPDMSFIMGNDDFSENYKLVRDLLEDRAKSQQEVYVTRDGVERSSEKLPS